MIALKPYPAYKDSGVPWLGKVPEHWELPRLGALLRERGEINSDGRVSEVLSVLRDRGVIPYSEKGNIGNKKSEDITRYKVVRSDDIVMNCMNVIIGSVGLSRYTGCLSPVYYVLTRRSEYDDPHYLNACFQIKPFQQSLVRIGNGILAHRMRIPMELLKCEPFPRPPTIEQAATVRFLDHMDRQTRRYISVKQKLIKLLEEHKQAIIQRAVTRGLDPNVRLKPSGVEWVGDVPEHWEVKRLKSLVRRIDQGVSPQAENYLVDGESWGVLKAGCVNRGVFRASEHKRLPPDFPIDSNLVVAVGDVLVSRASGSPHLVGSVGRVEALNYRLILSDKTFRPIFKQEADPDFMVLAMNSRYYRQQVEQAISGAEGLANNLPLSSLRTVVLVVPPAEEQRQIVDEVYHSTRELLGTVTRAEGEISLLREYRTRLIADVVTGKLDVRGLELPTADETAELEDFDGGEDVADLTEDIDEAEVIEEEDDD